MNGSYNNLFDKEANFVQDISNFIELKGIFDIFHTLYGKLIIDQPEEPIDFLIELLKIPERKKIFIILPESLKGGNICQEVAKLENWNYINLEETTLLDNDQAYDEKEILALKIENLKSISKDKSSNYFIEGFPNTKGEALSFRISGLIPTKLIALNSSPKLEFHNDDLPNLDLEVIKDEEEKRYLKKLQDINEVIPIEIRNFQQVQSLENIVLNLKEDINSHKPITVKKCVEPRISVIGPNHSLNEYYARIIAITFGMGIIEKKELRRRIRLKSSKFAQEIEGSRQTSKEINLEIFNQILKKFNERDSKDHGWVIEGYPNNEELFEMLRGIDKPINTIVFIEEKISNNSGEKEINLENMNDFNTSDQSINLTKFMEKVENSNEVNIVKISFDNSLEEIEEEINEKLMDLFFL